MIQRIRDEEFAVSPSGIHIGHTGAEVAFLTEVIGRAEVAAFIEIGVHLGGLAEVMMAIVPEYLGIEIDPRIVVDRVNNQITASQSADIWIADAWNRMTVFVVADWLAVRGTTLIYCDGGDKPKEFAFYAPVIRKGDLIGVHDYGTYEGAEISPVQAGETATTFGLNRFGDDINGAHETRIAIWKK